MSEKKTSDSVDDEGVNSSCYSRTKLPKSTSEKSTLAIKLCAALICVALFIANSYVIFKQFASHNTILAAKFVEEDTLRFPTLIICNASAYKNPKFPDFRLDSYLNNTIALSDFLIAITQPDKNGEAGVIENEKMLYNSTYSSVNITIEAIRSYYRGNCFKVEYRKKVQALEQIVFYLVPNSDLWIYVLRPEDVFFMHYDFWPHPMPFIFRHDRHTMTQDVLIKKELGFEKSKRCNSESAYTDCLRKVLNERVYKSKEYPNCTVPWHQNLLGEPNYSDDEISPCDEKQLKTLSHLDIKYVKNAAAYRHADCQACEFENYVVNTLSYDKFSEPSVGYRRDARSNLEDQKTQENKEYHGGISWNRDEIKTIYLYYVTTEIKVKSSELLVTFSSFVSAVGGNLGIFIGFSFLGFFTKFHDMIKTLLH